MHPILHNNGAETFCLAQLPPGAGRLSIFNDEQPYLSYFIGVETFRFYLPLGQWKLLGKADELSSWNKKEIVGRINNGGFTLFTSSKNEVTGSWTESFSSLLSSHSLPEISTYVLQKIKH